MTWTQNQIVYFAGGMIFIALGAGSLGANQGAPLDIIGGLFVWFGGVMQGWAAPESVRDWLKVAE